MGFGHLLLTGRGLAGMERRRRAVVRKPRRSVQPEWLHAPPASHPDLARDLG